MIFLNVLKLDLCFALVFIKVLGRLLKPLLIQSIQLFRDKRLSYLCCCQEGIEEAGDGTHSIILYHANCRVQSNHIEMLYVMTCSLRIHHEFMVTYC